MAAEAPGLAAVISERSVLLRTLAAGRRLAALTAALEADGGTVLHRLTGGRAVEPFRHYPAGDCYDPASHAQFYYHSHRDGEFGHVHLFQRPRGMPRGLSPGVPTSDPDAPCHLIAVGLDGRGGARRLFTTNRWVTGEAWYRGGAVKAMVGGLRLAPGGPMAPVAGWLDALVAFYRPLIEVLVDERDQALEDWRRAHPGRGDGLDDDRLEITSSRAIDPAADLAELGG